MNFDKFEFSKWEGIMIQPYFENFTPWPPSIAVVSEGHEYKIHMTNQVDCILLLSRNSI